MVFQITDYCDGRLCPRWLAHVGIAEGTIEDFSMGQSAIVIHMGSFIEVGAWSGGKEKSDLRIEVSGSTTEIDDLTRDDIVDRAMCRYSAAAPSIFRQRGINSCYWMGDHSIDSHPSFPSVEGTYAFSCATFVHKCYSEVVGPVVDLESMPLLSDEERRKLEEVLPPQFIQQTPFRRLYPSYLIHALCQSRFPFRPDDWDACKDHSIFISAQFA